MRLLTQRGSSYDRTSQVDLDCSDTSAGMGIVRLLRTGRSYGAFVRRNSAQPRVDPRAFGAEREVHASPLVVTCTLCAKSKTLSVGQRNDSAFPGEYCDGEFGKRHPIKKMEATEA